MTDEERAVRNLRERNPERTLFRRFEIEGEVARIMTVGEWLYRHTKSLPKRMLSMPPPPGEVLPICPRCADPLHLGTDRLCAECAGEPTWEDKDETCGDD